MEKMVTFHLNSDGMLNALPRGGSPAWNGGYWTEGKWYPFKMTLAEFDKYLKDNGLTTVNIDDYALNYDIVDDEGYVFGKVIPNTIRKAQ